MGGRRRGLSIDEEEAIQPLDETADSSNNIPRAPLSRSTTLPSVEDQLLLQQQQQQQQQPHHTAAGNRKSLHSKIEASPTSNSTFFEPSPTTTNLNKPHALPLKINDIQQAKKQKALPRLIHPILHKIPMHIRFGFNGFLSNVIFMVGYNAAIANFESMANPSTIYSVVYLIFIPVSHACISLLVFGWPDRYIPSLMSNFPIGITAIALGAVLTAYLDKVEFDELVVELLKQDWSSYFSSSTRSDAIKAGMSRSAAPLDERNLAASASLDGSNKDGIGEFYSSLLVLFVTGIWTFILSVFVNSPAEPTDKKEL